MKEIEKLPKDVRGRMRTHISRGIADLDERFHQSDAWELGYGHHQSEMRIAALLRGKRREVHLGEILKECEVLDEAAQKAAYALPEATSNIIRHAYLLHARDVMSSARGNIQYYFPRIRKGKSDANREVKDIEKKVQEAEVYLTKAQLGHLDELERLRSRLYGGIVNILTKKVQHGITREQNEPKRVHEDLLYALGDMLEDLTLAETYAKKRAIEIDHAAEMREKIKTLYERNLRYIILQGRKFLQEVPTQTKGREPDGRAILLESLFDYVNHQPPDLTSKQIRREALAVGKRLQQTYLS